MTTGAAEEKKEIDKQMAAFKKEFNLTDQSTQVKALNNTISREFEKLEANVVQQADQQKFVVDDNKAKAMKNKLAQVDKRLKRLGKEIASKTSLKGLKEKKAVKETDAAKKAKLLTSIKTLGTKITTLTGQKTKATAQKNQTYCRCKHL
jgi:hypothetical protein